MKTDSEIIKYEVHEVRRSHKYMKLYVTSIPCTKT